VFFPNKNIGNYLLFAAQDLQTMFGVLIIASIGRESARIHLGFQTPRVAQLANLICPILSMPDVWVSASIY
jgi:hypothetical protein